MGDVIVEEVKPKEPEYQVSIDPGIAFCSIVVSEVSDTYRVVEPILVKNNRAFTPEEKIIEKKHGARAVKMLAINNKLIYVLDKYKIDTVIIEAPFYNPRRPQAYGSLLEVIFGIKYGVLIPRDMGCNLIEPRSVKKLFTENGAAAKELMKQFLISKKEAGEIIIEFDIETLSEHEIDGIAIGFVHWLTQKQNKE